MAGALRPATPKGRVKLDIAKPAVKVEARPAAPQPKATAEAPAPNPNLQASIEAADANPAPAASNAEAKAEKPKPTRAAQIVKVVADVANAVDPRPSRKIPTADEWEPLMQRGLVYASVLYIWWLTTDDDGNDIDTREFELDEERAGLIVPPFARMWARTPLNRRYGRDLIENLDVLVSVVAVVTYVMDTRPLWRARRERQQLRQSGNKVIPMRREQTKTAPAPVQQPAPVRPEPQPLESQAKTNGGTQPNADSEPTTDGPYKRALTWTPGQQHSTD